MIEAWLNERGYYVKTPKGESTFVFDVPFDIQHDASALYTFRWVVFNQAIESLSECEDTKGQELVLHLDSRLVEEINGAITPDNHFAKSSLQYFLVVDAGKFRRVDCRKCTAATINGRLQLNGQSLSTQEGVG